MTLSGRVTVAHAGSLREDCLRLLEQEDDVVLDWGATDHLDTAVLQVLLTFRGELSRRGRRLLVTPPSEAVHGLLVLAGLVGAFAPEETKHEHE